MRPHGNHAVVSASSPEAFAVCDRCSRWWNRSKLSVQIQWAGTALYSNQILVCPLCYDTPNEQLRTIILPPDPPPIINARVENFAYDENGPVQSTLTVGAAQGATTLNVSSATGFAIGNSVWVQLNNATYGGMTLSAVNTVANTLTLSNPLSFSAPNGGSVTVALAT